MTRTAIWMMFMVGLISTPGFSASAIAVTTPDGIVVGVDVKSVDRCDGPCGPQTDSKKIVLVQGRVAVATAGLHTILGNPHLVAPYSFSSFAGQVGSRLGRNPTASQVSETVKQEAGKVLSWFDLYLRRGLVQQRDFPGEHPVEYLIAGYEGEAAIVHAVQVDIDWQGLRLKGVGRVVLCPTADARAHCAVCGVGSTRVLRELADQRGDLYQAVMTKAPVEARRLLDKEAISLQEAVRLVGALLEVEAGANPEHVGPPFNIATIPKGGRAVLTVASGRSP